MALSSTEIAIIKLTNWLSINRNSRWYRVSELEPDAFTPHVRVIVQLCEVQDQSTSISRKGEGRTYAQAADFALENWAISRPYG